MAAAAWVVAGWCAGSANAIVNSDAYLCSIGRLKPPVFTLPGQPTSFVIINAPFHRPVQSSGMEMVQVTPLRKTLASSP